MQTIKPESIALFLSIATNILGLLAWYNSTQQKRFAAESEFRRLAENQHKILQAIDRLEHLQEESEDAHYKREIESFDKVRTEVSNLRGVINALTIKLTDKSISAFLGGE